MAFTGVFIALCTGIINWIKPNPSKNCRNNGDGLRKPNAVPIQLKAVRNFNLEPNPNSIPEIAISANAGSVPNDHVIENQSNVRLQQPNANTTNQTNVIPEMEISFNVGLLPNDNVVEVDHSRTDEIDSKSQENFGSSVQNELLTEKSVTSSFEDGDVVQTQANKVALFVEICVEFIETNGLDYEGLYRVPGRQAAADRIYQKHKEATKDFNLNEMNVSVSTVATALKIFFQRKMPLFTQEQMSEINDIFLIPDRSKKLLALRDLLTRLSPANYNALMFLIQHLVKVTEKAKVNRMTAKNLAICWCPTILPMNFTYSARYQMVRPQLEGAVEAMIENFAFFFSRENESAPESDGITRGREPELKKNLGFFQHVKSTIKNSAQKNLMKNSQAVEAEINSHTTSMVIDKKNYDSFIPTELWGELGKPELQQLDKAYFKLRKRTGKYKSLLKQNDIKGYFMGVIKIGENEHLFPILVFDKPEMPNFLGKRVFLVLQLDQMKNADFMQKSKKKKEEKKKTGDDGDQRKDFLPEPAADKIKSKSSFKIMYKKIYDFVDVVLLIYGLDDEDDEDDEE
ncbi:hypothetical protein DAPPUDRAFT_103402 [Daphnia pulex]|uniref:Rho-GAP domain-containing protein n=1 Tax=Daphnia pulex TaxID=6669 RepID=E9GJ73_DAPPU|nr:hypothetical protein DAPPUDRAFT_103402 [Daphnia pulex]|eukprot:EFX80536.1 hypothetical protein DAPPUDRAFT_103402 [Daphnia pulex]